VYRKRLLLQQRRETFQGLLCCGMSLMDKYTATWRENNNNNNNNNNKFSSVF
jgi:hypothetical protein